MHQDDLAAAMAMHGYAGGGLMGLARAFVLPDLPDPEEVQRQAESLVREHGGRAVRQALPVGRVPQAGPPLGPRGRAAETWGGCVIRTHPVLGRYSPACKLAHVGAARVETGGRFTLLSHKVKGTFRSMRITMDGTSFVQVSYQVTRRSRPLAEDQAARDPERKDGWASDVSWKDDPSKPPLVVMAGNTFIFGPRIAAEKVRDAVTWWPGTAIPGYDPMVGHPLEAKEKQVRGASEAIARRHISAGLRGDALLLAIRRDQIALAVRVADGNLANARAIAGHAMRPDRAIWREMEAGRPGPVPPVPEPGPAPAPIPDVAPIPDGAAGGGIRVMGMPLWAVGAGAAVVALVGVLIFRRR